VVDYFKIDDSSTHFSPSIYNPKGFDESEDYLSLESTARKIVASNPIVYQQMRSLSTQAQLRVGSSSSSATTSNSQGNNNNNNIGYEVAEVVDGSNEKKRSRWGVALETLKTLSSQDNENSKRTKL
jgi:hypothetical protein